MVSIEAMGDNDNNLTNQVGAALGFTGFHAACIYMLINKPGNNNLTGREKVKINAILSLLSFALAALRIKDLKYTDFPSLFTSEQALMEISYLHILLCTCYSLVWGKRAYQNL